MVAVVGVFGAGFAGYAIGQNNTRTPALEELAQMQVKMYAGAKPDDYGTLARIYMEAPQHPEVTQQIIRQLLVKAPNNAEIQGQALALAQNARIIELLEKQQKP